MLATREQRATISITLGYQVPAAVWVTGSDAIVEGFPTSDNRYVQVW